MAVDPDYLDPLVEIEAQAWNQVNADARSRSTDADRRRRVKESGYQYRDRRCRRRRGVQEEINLCHPLADDRVGVSELPHNASLDEAGILPKQMEKALEEASRVLNDKQRP